ncbi:uncharacterized protein KY384_001658 [Bacidia gigantensis]|uniref:uncharacterized protein n=1 Tax=Bacidia gigantensis TaxID=2732470 RepID=UPI001D050522|nr:uncharacterized protein KY384_001658 [Bacidia gigantensis]KAG8533917.1 hypothetical protein KY384_001658 [Bacidia gigantensis]
MVSASPWKDSLHAGPAGPMSNALFATIVTFDALALWMVLEINLGVSRLFKKYNGLYYWSILISSWGIVLHTVGYILKWWAPGSPWALNTCFNLFGWSMMVTFQSLVLYSRLHLVILNWRILRAVLILIIFTAITVETPQWVTSWGATNPQLSTTKHWTPIDSIMIRVSQVWFLLQEGLLSGLYIWGAIHMLTPNAELRLKKIMWELIATSTVLVALDLITVSLAYLNLHVPKEPLQGFVYALKLKLEIFILNQLLAVLDKKKNSFGGYRYRYGTDSEKKSGSRTKSATRRHDLEASVDSEKERFGLPSVARLSRGRPWFPSREVSKEDSGGQSSDTSTFGLPESARDMRQASSPKPGFADESKIAWVRHEIEIARSSNGR